MHHADAHAVGETEHGRTLLDAFGLEPNDPAKKVDLLDALPLDALGELRRLGCRIVSGGLPVPPAHGFQGPREVARHLCGTDEVDVAGDVDREHSWGLDLVVLRPEGQSLSANEQCPSIAAAQNLIDLLLRESDLGQWLSHRSAIHPATRCVRLAYALAGATAWPLAAPHRAQQAHDRAPAPCASLPTAASLRPPAHQGRAPRKADRRDARPAAERAGWHHSTRGHWPLAPPRPAL